MQDLTFISPNSELSKCREVPAWGVFIKKTDERQMNLFCLGNKITVVENNRHAESLDGKARECNIWGHKDFKSFFIHWGI